jgi:hypothetical protein
MTLDAEAKRLDAETKCWMEDTKIILELEQHE